jgi:hypothetical protein
MEQTDLVIVEVGACENVWPLAWPCRPPVVAVFQDRRESASRFAERVTARLDRLWSQGSWLRRVFLLGEDTLDIETLGARLSILRKIRARERLEARDVRISLELLECVVVRGRARAGRSHRARVLAQWSGTTSRCPQTLRGGAMADCDIG